MHRSQAARDAESAAQPRHILIADDDPNVAEVFRDFLERAGYTVEMAANGEDAQRRFTMKRPVAVLLDLRMPGQSGGDTFTALRRIDADVPIIIVSGNADDELACTMLRAGAFDYVVKPVTGHHLTVIVGAATGQPWSVGWDASGPRGGDVETRQIERIAYTVMALSRRLSVAAHRATVGQLGHEALRAALLGEPAEAIAHLQALDTLLLTDTLPALPRTDAVALREALRPLLGAASPRAQTPTVTERDNTDLSGLRVLVVDDTPDVVELLSVVLRGCGAIVVAAQSAKEALAAFDRDRVDVVVTDLAMPGYDGFWLIEQLRRGAEPRRLVAIAMSGAVRDERGRILRAGFDDFLQKPLEPTELCRRVAHLMAA